MSSTKPLQSSENDWPVFLSLATTLFFASMNVLYLPLQVTIEHIFRESPWRDLPLGATLTQSVLTALLAAEGALLAFAISFVGKRMSALLVIGKIALLWISAWLLGLVIACLVLRLNGARPIHSLDIAFAAITLPSGASLAPLVGALPLVLIRRYWGAELVRPNSYERTESAGGPDLSTWYAAGTLTALALTFLSAVLARLEFREVIGGVLPVVAISPLVAVFLLVPALFLVFRNPGQLRGATYWIGGTLALGGGLTVILTFLGYVMHSLSNAMRSGGSGPSFDAATPIAVSLTSLSVFLASLSVPLVSASLAGVRLAFKSDARVLSASIADE